MTAGELSEPRAVELTGAGLEEAAVVAVARESAPVAVTAEARKAMAASAAIVERLASSGEPAYGVTTGFGSLATVPIPADARAQLQRSLLRSHAAGMGPPVETEVVRAMMLLRARTLAMGYSGARPELAEAIVAILNAGLTPVVPEHGSLGASGDLAPLAHCALPLIGEGEVTTPDGRRLPAAEALAAAGLEPLELVAKEGLALINGTDGILGMLVLAVCDLRRLLRAADIAAAMSAEALLGTDRAFAEDLVALRPQPGQALSAGNLRRLLDGSAIVASHRHGDPRVQDAYSLRCAPQVIGAARDALGHAERMAAAELRGGDRQPDGAARRPGRVVRQLPRSAARPRLRPACRRGRAGRRDRRTPNRPPARRRALARTPAVPGRRPRRRLRPDDRPLHPGRDGGREPPPCRPRRGRLAADQRDAGGPRLDGLGRGAQAAIGDRKPRPGSSPSS